jgi:hypothetical protein
MGKLISTVSETLVKMLVMFFALITGPAVTVELMSTLLY